MEIGLLGDERGESAQVSGSKGKGWSGLFCSRLSKDNHERVQEHPKKLENKIKRKKGKIEKGGK